MTIEIDLPENLFAAVEKEAAKMSVTFQAVVQAALRWHLIEVPVHAVPFKLSTVRGRLVDETIDLDKTSALLPADDEEQYGRI